MRATTAACGTDSGYHTHIRAKQVPCRPCCDAHATAVAQWRARKPRKPRGADEPLRYIAARDGHEPAEALTTRDRWRLVAELHRAGMTDEQVAAHTRMTVYTAARIRQGMSLPANAPAERERIAA